MAWSMWNTPRFSAGQIVTCSECKEHTAVADAAGNLPKGWKIDQLLDTNKRGELVPVEKVASCPSCQHLQAELDREERIERECDTVRYGDRW